MHGPLFVGTAGLSVADFRTPGLYGDGGDGAYTAPVGTTTLTSDRHYTTLVVPAGATIKTAGYRLLASVSITVESGGVIEFDGAAASGFTAGLGAAAGASALLGGGGNGGVGAQTATSGNNATTFGPAYGGHTTGTGGANGHGNAGGTSVPSSTPGRNPRSLHELIVGAYLTNGATSYNWTKFYGGIGGGGGAGSSGAGGGGGGGGGVMVLGAPVVINSGRISCNGGAGANAATTPSNSQAGGGQGGGGGVVVAFAQKWTGNTPQANGGTGGSPGPAGGSAGSAGQPGKVFQFLAA